MLDPTFIKECADPSLRPPLVEQFVAAAGSEDPFAVTVKSGGRLVLVPKAKSVDEAMAIARQYVGQAVVRVGLTQLPAGVGSKDAADLLPDLVEPCENLHKGTALFAKVLRIVAKWYGNPKSEEVFPQIFEDAVYAWKTGEFEGVSVFHAADPGRAIEPPRQSEVNSVDDEAVATPEKQSDTNEEVDRAGIRIDLSGIGGN